MERACTQQANFLQYFKGFGRDLQSWKGSVRISTIQLSPSYDPLFQEINERCASYFYGDATIKPESLSSTKCGPPAILETARANKTGAARCREMPLDAVLSHLYQFDDVSRKYERFNINSLHFIFKTGRYVSSATRDVQRHLVICNMCFVSFPRSSFFLFLSGNSLSIAFQTAILVAFLGCGAPWLRSHLVSHYLTLREPSTVNTDRVPGSYTCVSRIIEPRTFFNRPSSQSRIE